MFKPPISPESLIEQEVRQLFERHTIAEIKVREDLTRDEIEKKKQELRRLVGTRYRDLIDSADSVIAMKTAAEGLASGLERLEHHTSRLLNHIRKPQALSTTANESSNEHKEHRERYHVALQVKLLVNAPEQIWSSVEANDYLKATLLYTEAEQTHTRLIHDPASAPILKNIPLLPRQWSLISQFPIEIRQNARAQLQKSGVSPQHYAGSLCSLMILDHLSVTQALNVFLEAQKALVLSLFDSSSQATSNALPLDELGARMGQLVELVHRALFSMGLIFSSRFASSAYGLSASLLTGSLQAPGTARLVSTTSSSSVSEADLEKGCRTWLESVAESLRWGLRHALLEIKLAKDLDSIRARVLEVIDSPTFPEIDDTKKTPSNEGVWKLVCDQVVKRGFDIWDYFFNEAFVEASRNLISVWFRSVNLGLPSSDALALHRSDEDVSIGHFVWKVDGGRTILGKRVESKEAVNFKASTLTPRLAELIAHFDKQLEACMQDLAHLLPHQFSSGTSLSVSSGSITTRTYSPSRRRPNEVGSTSLGTRDELTRKGSGNAIITSDGEETQQKEARKREREEKEKLSEVKLREYLQESCFQAISALLNQLNEKLSSLAASTNEGGREALSSPMKSSKEPQHITPEERLEQALFIGRAGRALMLHSTQLKRIFTVPKAVQAEGDTNGLKAKGNYSYTASKALSRRLALKRSQAEEEAESVHPKLHELHAAFRRLFLRAHCHWANSLAQSLLNRLKEAIQADDWSEREKRRMQWQPITVAVETLEDDAKGSQGKKKVVEETFYLPFQPSAYVLSFLFSACREVHRVFAHAPDSVVLNYLASQLLHGVCDQYGRLADANEVKERVSKEGAIQLMFDAKFLSDVLIAGTAPPHDEIPDELAAYAFIGPSVGAKNSLCADMLIPPSNGRSAGMKERIKGIHQHLQNLLDPIDRAFYAPHVNRMEQQCYARSAALLGPLVSLHPLYTDVKVQGSHGDQYNTLPMVAAAPRFRYLPITEPVTKGKEKGPVVSGFGMDTTPTQLPSFASLNKSPASSPLLAPPSTSAGSADGSGGSFMEQFGRKFGFLSAGEDLAAASPFKSFLS